MISRDQLEEVVMLPLTEVMSIKWTDERREKMRSLRGDMSLTSLARKLDEYGVSISRQYLHRMETDPEVRGASPELVTGFCKVFDCTLAELLCLNAQKIVQLGIDKRNF